MTTQIKEEIIIKTLSKDDVCVYYKEDGNGSLNIVEVTEIIDSETSKIKCIQVIIDNSGNGWFKYLLETQHEMVASNKYLYPINIITELNNNKLYKRELQNQQLEINSLKAFKSYFDDLYNQGLEIANWHQNGESEPFDDFYESALKEMKGEYD